MKKLGYDKTFCGKKKKKNTEPERDQKDGAFYNYVSVLMVGYPRFGIKGTELTAEH